MLSLTFHGFLFWFFLAAVWLLWRLAPGSGYRRVVLAASGLVFYYLMQPETVVLLAAITVFTYLAGSGIQRAALPQLRQRLLWLGIGSSLACLIVYKYAGMMGSWGERLAEVAPGLRAGPGQYIVPIGISYYVFQSIGWLVDCHRGHAPDKSSLLDYTTYLTFFPHISAGPILRSMDFLPQLRERMWISSAVLWESISRIAFGLFKKLVIADNLAAPVHSVYDNLAAASPLEIIVATYAFAVQIYCDFSGYTDVALGAALLFGLKLPENFRWPYLAESIVDFWNRWHISLSTWLRDYVYFSLPGLRSGSRWAAHRNLLITMGLCGIWHGAGWTFLLWGLYHGVLLVGYRLAQPLWESLKRLPGWLTRLCAILLVQQLVAAGWILFRVNSIGDLRILLGNVTSWSGASVPFSALSSELKWAGCLILTVWLWQFVQGKVPLQDAVRSRPWNPWAMSFLLLVGMAIATFRVPTAIPFVYFRF